MKNTPISHGHRISLLAYLNKMLHIRSINYIKKKMCNYVVHE